MKIATWNCQGGLDNKLDVVGTFAADVLIIQECARTTKLSADSSISSQWKTPGATESKGIGVFAFNGWSLRTVTAPEDLPWVLPVSVSSPDGREAFTLLATWTNTSGKDGRPSYAGQVAKLIDVWGGGLDHPTIIAGDLNSSAQGPQKEPHAANIERLASLGVQSMYHRGNDLPHGKEQDMTLKWIGPGKKEYFYHCDFIFASSHFSVSSAEIAQIWATHDKQRSDHQPVLATVQMIDPAKAT